MIVKLGVPRSKRQCHTGGLDGMTSTGDVDDPACGLVNK